MNANAECILSLRAALDEAYAQAELAGSYDDMDLAVYWWGQVEAFQDELKALLLRLQAERKMCT